MALYSQSDCYVKTVTRANCSTLDQSKMHACHNGRRSGGATLRLGDAPLPAIAPQFRRSLRDSRRSLPELATLRLPPIPPGIHGPFSVAARERCVDTPQSGAARSRCAREARPSRCQPILPGMPMSFIGLATHRGSSHAAELIASGTADFNGGADP